MTKYLLVLFVLAAVPAVAQTVSVVAPAGDAAFSKGHGAPGFLDIVGASMTIGEGITFTADLAADLTSLPDVNGMGAYFWTFPMNTDPSTNPPGFPFDPHAALPVEFIAFAFWDGAEFSAIFLDRRPALTGDPILRWSIPVSVDGSRLTLTVPPELAARVVALPGAWWHLASGWWNTPQVSSGTNAIHFADSTANLAWPQ